MAVPLLAVFLIAISGRNPNLREGWTIAASITMFLVIASMVPQILGGSALVCDVAQPLPGLLLSFRVDALGISFALTASFLWIITSFYAIGYVRSLGEKNQTRFFAFFALTMAATMGVAFSGNLFTTFVFYEIITFATFPLVAHKQTREALAGARKYLTFLMGTSVAFFLLAIVMTWQVTGRLDFSADGIFGDVKGSVSSTLLIVIFVLYIAGVAKAALMPFHSWLPSAMVAPTPVSALLHAVAVVKTGVFVIIKVSIHIFGVGLLKELGMGTFLAALASFTIIFASITALRQDNLKARLAYSTIGQLSYVVLGVSLLTTAGITGSIMHIVLHAFGKITLFFAAGAIYVAAHKTKVSELNGIGRQMPLTMGAFTIATFSMIGVPPFAGFLTKWLIGSGAVQADMLIIIVVLAVSTVLNASYFLPIVYAAFFREPDSGRDEGVKDATPFMTLPILITAAGVLMLFIWPSLFYDLAVMTVKEVTGGV